MRALLVIFLVACTSCSPEPEGPPPTITDPRIAEAQKAAMRAEQQNLLNIGFGAAVVSRTAELTLDNSAIRAIDGDPDSTWATPPLDIDQTLTFSLPAPARVEQVGVRTPVSPLSRAKALMIETSADGQIFSPLVSLELEQTLDPQMFAGTVEAARFIRVRTTEGGTRMAALQSILVHGSWLSPPAIAPFSGCFAINEGSARFQEHDGRVFGRVGGENAQFVDGGVDDATYRFAWTRGPEWGYALITLTPDGNTLSGVTWHEEAAAHSFGTSWYGERRSCADDAYVPDPNEVVRTFLRRSGWYPLFSLRFAADGSLIEQDSRGGLQVIEMVQRRTPGHRMRLVAREYGAPSPEAARKSSESRLRSLEQALRRLGVDTARIDFVVAGSDAPRRPVEIETMRRFYGVIEIELSETARSAF